MNVADILNAVGTLWDFPENKYADRYRIPRKLTPHIKSISLYGDRFITALTEEGKIVSKTMTPEDWEDRVHIPDDQYLKLFKDEH